MKQQILEIIFDRFDNWSTQFGFACDKGCAVCCTTDVSITALEGELILDHIVTNHSPRWLTDKLDVPPVHRSLLQTTNDYAEACLEGRQPEEEKRRGGICPFLQDVWCSIYPARPFSCRCFASTVCCRREGSALLPAEYLSAATAVSQIIEHVGQFGLWGTMIDVLTLQASAAGYLSPGSRFDEHLSAARGNCLTAKPLPGFLIEDEHYEKVAGLLDHILNARLKGRTVEDILNNR